MILNFVGIVEQNQATTVYRLGITYNALLKKVTENKYRRPLLNRVLMQKINHSLQKYCCALFRVVYVLKSTPIY